MIEMKTAVTKGGREEAKNAQDLDPQGSPAFRTGVYSYYSNT